MKKIFSLLIISVFLISLAYAASTTTVNTVNPDIKASFNESVILRQATLKFLADDSLINLTNRTIDNNMTFFFKPVQSLLSGFYYFVVDASDKIGNAKQYTQNIIVDVRETFIFPVNPKLGIGTTESFDFTVGTTRNATCRYSYFEQDYGKMTPFSKVESGNTRHIVRINNAREIEQGPDKEEREPQPFFVKCIDDLGFNVSAILGVGWDSTPPIIKSIDKSIDPVVNLDNPTTDITVHADDKVLCYIDDHLFTTQIDEGEQVYSFNPTTKITYPANPKANKKYDYKIYCKNKAQTPSAITQSSVTLSLKDNLTIYVNSPTEFVNGVIYDITTNKEAICQAKLDSGGYEDLMPIDEGRTRHTKLPVLPSNASNAKHILQYSCVSGGESVKTQVIFTIDTTPATQPVINASACTKDKIIMNFYSYDNQSGIKGYNYSISGDNLSIPLKFTDKSYVEEGKLNLSLGKSYTVYATAINKAGLISSQSSLQITFNPNITSACWEKIPPVLKLNITNSSLGKKVNILCFDESGCDSTSIRYGEADDKNCNATIQGSEKIMQKSAYLCYEASDIYGNKAQDIKYISVDSAATSCYNGFLDGTETDLDCGSICSPCAVGLKCKVSSDCETNACLNNVCIKTYCNDTIKNGFETDVDCGGKACSPCSIGKSCVSNSDCGSNSCGKTNVCEATSCSDGIKNGFETDVDCGGKACSPCSGGSSCISNKDCSSGSCQFNTCTTAKETWEEWAAKNGIDPADRDKKYPGKSWTYYQEYLRQNGEFTSPTESILSNLMGYLAILLGVLILASGLLMLYYFKTDKNTSLYVIIIGAVVLVAAIIGVLFAFIPKPILLVLTVLGLGGAGYFVYEQKEIIIQKISGKPQTRIQLQKILSQSNTQVQQQTINKNQIEKPQLSKEDILATQQMIAMIKKQKLEKERSKENTFSIFEDKKPQIIEKKTTILEPIRTKIVSKKIEKTTPIVTFVEKKEVPKQNKEEVKKIEGKPKEKGNEFDKLSNLTKRNEKQSIDKIAELSKLKDDKKLSKEEAFDKLSKITRSKVDDLFSKLPSSNKSIDELSKLDKKKKGENK